MILKAPITFHISPLSTTNMVRVETTYEGHWYGEDVGVNTKNLAKARVNVSRAWNYQIGKAVSEILFAIDERRLRAKESDPS